MMVYNCKIPFLTRELFLVKISTGMDFIKFLIVNMVNSVNSNCRFNRILADIIKYEIYENIDMEDLGLKG